MKKTALTSTAVGRLLLLLLSTVASIIVAGCGKRAPPLPPLARIRQVAEINYGQQGNRIIINVTIPTPSKGRKNTRITRIDVYRLAESPNAPLTLNSQEFAARASVVGVIPYDDIKNPSAPILFTDQLELTSNKVRFRYGVRFVNSNGQSTDFSNILLVTPSTRIALPPEELTALESQASINIEWKRPLENIDGSTPVNILGYNIYRSTKSEIVPVLLNTAPLNDLEYQDRKFVFGDTYTYFIRTVSLGDAGAPIESIDSSTVTITPQDTFRPSAPISITIAAAPAKLSLFFPANPETDIAGYYVYRTQDPTLPKEEWRKMNNALLTRTTFADESVESGKTYHYYLIAVDTAGNLSDPSETVFETVP